MEWLGVGITILGTAASVGGIVLYVFNGTKKLIKEIHATTIQTNKMMYKMNETMNKMNETINKMNDMLNKMNETMKQNHRDSLRLLNKIVDLIDSRLPAEKRAGKIKRKSLKH
jgi:methyl-accepting chemotaxis protein